MPICPLSRSKKKKKKDIFAHISVQDCDKSIYRIYPTIRWGVCPSRMTSNNLIGPMKCCCNTNFTLPRQSQGSKSVLQGPVPPGG